MKPRAIVLISQTILAGTALLAAPAAFADYVFQFRGPVAGCVSNSGGCEATEEIFLEITLDSANYTLGTDVNEVDTYDPRALHAFRYYIELNYPPNPPTSTGKHIIWGSTFPTTGINTPDFALRALNLPATFGASATSAVDFAVTRASLATGTTSLVFDSNAAGWWIQSAEMDAKTIKYTRYSGQGGSWKLLFPNIVHPPGGQF